MAKKKTKIVTHSGSFHPDDVFAVATLSHYIKGELEIVRSREKNDWKTGDFVIDVGGEYDEAINHFDHHQIGGAGKRENGIPFASFGLVWKKFGPLICDSETVSGEIDRKLVQQIDALDNGVDIIKPLMAEIYPYLVGNVIFSYLPTWKDEMTEDEAFLSAVDFARSLLAREIKHTRDREEGKSHVAIAYENSDDKRIIILERDYPWGEIMSRYPEPLLVVYPQGSNWHVKTVRSDMRSFGSRIQFPQSWAGTRDAELQKVSKVDDAIFCHTKRFLVVAKTREGAVTLAKKTISGET
ncbi:MAG: hypothetical protein A2928_02850 [Candidatus Taylorbacteria bacterium RIFCSPLOWO2_01_FULL_45_15b]|uniref:Metal-dependent hydrolase n=1 Tax=Candidatus Taylorbacteria bacterium RIFCSPLOWO2_01_FULL_45_15b TaxID=1802319 RepID=A0A1G2NH15_9BACT|nr:MAG: hypothetical protein A2928_02850 [Candidatus Taylorbacteria bacterium RIFCSPLOWO2_01_FULL_45_15b]